MTSTELPLEIEIEGNSSDLLQDLVRIVNTCAIDLHFLVKIKTTTLAGKSRQTPKIAIKVPIQQAIANSQCWHFACRLSTFCPKAHIYTQVSG